MAQDNSGGATPDHPVAGDQQHGHQHEIHFLLDGEPETTTEDELTPNQIIENFAHLDPKTHYLVRMEGGKKIESYQGKGDIPIELHNGMQFQVISTGPTPVS